jgi:hypothetical protein
MPSSSTRSRAGSRAPVRRAARRPLGRGFAAAPVDPERPLLAPFAALFGLLAVFFALLGGGSAMWSALLLLVGPVGCLALSLRRPVREWTRPAGRARRGRRAGRRAS